MKSSQTMDKPVDQFPTWPCFAADEIAAVDRVLQSGKVNYWTGDEARRFETEFAASIQMPYAVALMNGTVALELALWVLGVGPGDEVVTSPRTFIASASCAAIRGARPVFADVDLDSQNITADTIERALSPRTKAIVLVHLAGWPCEMDEIVELAHNRNVALIEDCAQAAGAQYRGKPVGGFGEFGAFSFCQDKIITTGGEGGLLVMRDRSHWLTAWSLKDHGKSYEAAFERAHPVGFRWLHESFGTNWRLTEMQAAIGRAQLKKLPRFVAKRRDNAMRLIEHFQGIDGLRTPVPPTHVTHSYYKFYAFLKLDRLKETWSRDRVLAEINARGVPCFAGSCPEVYLEGAFDNSGSRPSERLPVAKALGETSLMFLVHPTLSAEHMDRAGEVVADVLSTAIR